MKAINFIGRVVFFVAMFPVCVFFAAFWSVKYASGYNGHLLRLKEFFRIFANELADNFASVWHNKLAGNICATAGTLILTVAAWLPTATNASEIKANAVEVELLCEKDTASQPQSEPNFSQEIVAVKVCKTLLDECRMAGILDDGGLAAYVEINKTPSVDKYVELIDECMQEDEFWDIVAEGDTYCNYQTIVLKNLK